MDIKKEEIYLNSTPTLGNYELTSFLKKRNRKHQSKIKKLIILACMMFLCGIFVINQESEKIKAVYSGEKVEATYLKTIGSAKRKLHFDVEISLPPKYTLKKNTIAVSLGDLRKFQENKIILGYYYKNRFYIGPVMQNKINFINIGLFIIIATILVIPLLITINTRKNVLSSFLTSPMNFEIRELKGRFGFPKTASINAGLMDSDADNKFLDKHAQDWVRTELSDQGRFTAIFYEFQVGNETYSNTSFSFDHDLVENEPDYIDIYIAFLKDNPNNSFFISIKS